MQDDTPPTWTWKDDVKLIAQISGKVLWMFVGVVVLVGVPTLIMRWAGCRGPS